MFQKLDDKVTQGYQWLYDYCLDRFGYINIGYFRATLVVIGMLFICHKDNLGAWDYFVLGCMGIMILIHIKEAVYYQKGMYLPLNVWSIYQKDNLFMMYFCRIAQLFGWVMLGVIDLVTLRPDDYIINKVFYLVWVYSLCLMVRDPDENRFKKLVEAKR